MYVLGLVLGCSRKGTQYVLTHFREHQGKILVSKILNSSCCNALASMYLLANIMALLANSAMEGRRNLIEHSLLPLDSFLKTCLQLHACIVRESCMHDAVPRCAAPTPMQLAQAHHE